MDTFNAASVRSYIASQGLKREDVPTPFWPDVNGHIALQDIPETELVSINNNPLCKNAMGQFDTGLFMAVLLCMSLIVKDTGELLFPISPTDFANRDLVAGLGGSLLIPVFKQAQAFFGMGDDDAVEAAKQAFLGSLTASSGTASPNPSGQA